MLSLTRSCCRTVHLMPNCFGSVAQAHRDHWEALEIVVATLIGVRHRPLGVRQYIWDMWRWVIWTPWGRSRRNWPWWSWSRGWASISSQAPSPGCLCMPPRWQLLAAEARGSPAPWRWWWQRQSSSTQRAPWSSSCFSHPFDLNLFCPKMSNVSCKPLYQTSNLIKLIWCRMTCSGMIWCRMRWMFTWSIIGWSVTHVTAWTHTASWSCQPWHVRDQMSNLSQARSHVLTTMANTTTTHLAPLPRWCMDENNVVTKNLETPEGSKSLSHWPVAAWLALQVHQHLAASLLLSDELQDVVEMLDEPFHLAQRLKDSMMPTHVRSKVYVLIRIVNVLTVDAQSVPASSARMLLKSTPTSHDDHLPVTAQFFIQLRLQDVIVPRMKTTHVMVGHGNFWCGCCVCNVVLSVTLRDLGKFIWRCVVDVGQSFSQVHHK